MKLPAFDEIDDEKRFGGKSTQLGAAIRFGLPVPPGVALEADFVDAVAAGSGDARSALHALHDALGGGPFAVRSSAVGEDSMLASFAGQHATVLNVCGRDALVDAVLTVRASGFTDAALSYRRKLGVTAPPRIGVAVQHMVPAECAGVLFSRNPMTGDDERVIEASWGLGEAVVAGLVTPDRYRIARDGRVIERVAGTKDLAIRPVKGGGTVEEEVAAELVHALCLDDARLARLHELAGKCESFFGGQQDLEWAFVADRLYLLQRRAITTRPASR
jgi:pyruvate,water dikinase